MVPIWAAVIVIPVLTAIGPEPWSTVRASLPVRLRLLIVIETRPLFSTSVNRKSDTANVLAVSSFDETLLACATGKSFTAVTLMFNVAETVPGSASPTLNSNLLRVAPFALDAGV